ncbi:hypothetical protein DXG03_003206 [Asterophora parasitica]|uniref:Methylthioribose-1-phosphate isomerase n=1 Tax=Asterophora parasitica TaxID=117018 RepID=A0A9P7GJS2_9AGAR|nr:hypothetical protein DXG03_003206 [Asterophora parasitica]
MAPLTSIRTENGKLEIVNQLLLPHTTEFLEIKTVEEAHDAIKTMKIRGAPAIASLASLWLSYHLTESLEASPIPAYLSSTEALKAHVEGILAFLYTARPTAVNLGAATRRLQNTLTASLAAKSDLLAIAKAIIAEGKLIADEDVGRNKEMSKWGAEWLLERVGAENAASGLNVMTVCNTGSLATSVREPLQYYLLTALELQTLQIPSVMLCDTMVGSLLQHHNIHAIEACLVRGALYPGTGNPTDEQAVVLITPRGLDGIYNPSFDVTPAELITAIVTEKGVAVRKDGEKTFDLSGIV